jgi:hypothetical protein
MRTADGETPELAIAPALQRDRLGRFLDEIEREHGPIDPAIMDEVRRRWPAHTEAHTPEGRRAGTHRAT